MEMRSALRALCAVAALVTGMACAGESAPALIEGGAQRVDEAKLQGYREAVAGFDAATRAAPQDVDIAVARCEFMGRYTDDESDWIASAADDYDACVEGLQRRFASTPQVQLFELDRLWGDEAADLGEKLLTASDGWPPALKRALLAKTSAAQQAADHEERAGELAVMAVGLGDTSRIASAVTYLVGRKQTEQAAELLRKAPPSELPWEGTQRVTAAMALPDARLALQELRRHPEVAGYSEDVAARAYLRAGDIASAQRVLAETRQNDKSLRAVRFDVALAAGDYATAARQVDITDRRNFGENLKRFCTLLGRSPAALAMPSMLMAALVCLLWLTAMALAPGLLLLPVHHRGLARRLKGTPATPLFESVGLSRAWYAAAIALCMPLAVALIVEPGVFTGEGHAAGAGMFRAMLWGESVALLCLLPALHGLRWRQLVGDRSALRSWWIVLLGLAGLMALGWLLNLVNMKLGIGTDTEQTRAISALAQNGVEVVGPFATVLLMALLVPIFEELTFRGLLLGGLSRHIGFGAANAIQSLLFALVHGDPPRFLYYFAMGLIAGWLVKRTKSLGPAVVLHVLNNAVATAALLSIIEIAPG